ncbi:sodium/potassium/calcium exchanger 2 isoform X2 [Electrophorus electricus]|uniref:sodium/potassium/calcium exchanger 2 isoform X2 n=1 Tax=Electrophorus electricus TaxID=8005 RepID=UPI0015CFD14D|nr:sodium/potassium/calcium exchanger 2 isoform X2 [Electrophorus electricus]
METCTVDLSQHIGPLTCPSTVVPTFSATELWPEPTPAMQRGGRCPRQRMGRKLRPSRMLGLALSICALSLLLSWSAFEGANIPALAQSGGGHLRDPWWHRTLRSTTDQRNVSADAPVAVASGMVNQGDYPDDLFSLEERRRGAVALHMFGMLYMFIALAIVCDEFFVPALTVITEKLAISDDVAGATFMAAGGSAPELFTSVIGVFVSHSNVGIGTIVGSAVFNILFVIGMCALFSREILNLTWWPLFRDVTFYIVDLVMLISFFLDNYITYLESMALLGAYGSYVLFMKFNGNIERLVKGIMNRNQVNGLEPAPKPTNSGDDENKLSAKPRLQRGGSSASLHNSLMRNSIFQLMIHTLDPLSEGKFKDKASILHKIVRKKEHDDENGMVDKKLPNSTRVEVEVTPPMNGNVGQETEEEEEGEDKPLSLAWPDGGRKQATYLFILPIVFPLWLTLPDVRRDSSKRFFPITFLGSISWIAIFSYLMVWWAHQVGETIGISEEIMGLTILAAGTSIPDLITSVIVARKGLGDMAVSSSVGSNIFDITVGLPFPWLFYSALHSLRPVTVSSNGLLCTIVLLFLMLLFVIISIAACKWKMSKLLGFIMFLLYIIFLVVSVMLEDKIITCPVSI